MKVSVLIPTCNRTHALVATLTALVEQRFKDFEVIISNQGAEELQKDPVIRTLCNIFALHGNPILILNNKPVRGMAQQRQFLLNQSQSPYVFFLDDDVILEKEVLQRLVAALEEEDCGFAGMGLIGLSYRNDIRKDEQQIEWWQEPVHPEFIQPLSRQWERHKLHNAANLLHLSRQLAPGEQRKYKVAWVGGCVLYHSDKLKRIGGFSFWKELPPSHCGEDVLVQIRMIYHYGGFGLLPSGAFHQELPTTLPDRTVNAPEYLGI